MCVLGGGGGERLFHLCINRFIQYIVTLHTVPPPRQSLFKQFMFVSKCIVVKHFNMTNSKVSVAENTVTTAKITD